MNLIFQTSGRSKWRSTATSRLWGRIRRGARSGAAASPSSAASSARESPEQYPRSSPASPSHHDGDPELPDRVPPASASVSTSTEQLAHTSVKYMILQTAVYILAPNTKLFNPKNMTHPPITRICKNHYEIKHIELLFIINNRTKIYRQVPLNLELIFRTSVTVSYSGTSIAN